MGKENCQLLQKCSQETEGLDIILAWMEQLLWVRWVMR